MPALVPKAITELPNNVQGTAVGEGYSCIGVAWDYTRGKVVVLNFGTGRSTDSTPYAPSIIVHDPSDFSTFETEHDISGTTTGACQGLAVLPSGNYLVADKDAGVAREFDGTTSEGSLFSLSGINGLCWHRGLSRILASSGATIYVREQDGTAESSQDLTAVTGGADIDHIFEFGDLVGITYGTSGTLGYVTYLDPSGWSEVGTVRTREIDAIEGGAHDDSGNFFCASDGDTHTADTGGSGNNIVTYRAYAGVTAGEAWSPADIDASLYDAITGDTPAQATTSGSTVTAMADFFEGGIARTVVSTPTLEAGAINSLDTINHSDGSGRGFSLGRPSAFADLLDDPDGTPHFVVSVIDNVDFGALFSTRSDSVAGQYLTVSSGNVSYFVGNLTTFSTLPCDSGTHIVVGMLNPDTLKAAVRVDGVHGPEVATGTQTTPSDITRGFRRTSGATGVASGIGSPDANGARIAEQWLVMADDPGVLHELMLRFEGYLADMYGVTLTAHPYADAVPGLGVTTGGGGAPVMGIGIGMGL
jgi:hypothetical protein